MVSIASLSGNVEWDPIWRRRRWLAEYFEGRTRKCKQSRLKCCFVSVAVLVAATVVVVVVVAIYKILNNFLPSEPMPFFVA